MIVNRDNGRYVEYLSPRMVSVDGVIDMADQNFLDSAVKFYAGDAISVPHLANMTVNILEDGVPLGEETANASGIVSITNSSATVIVGLPYVSQLETLNIEVPSKSGTLQGRKVKVSNVVLRLIDTIGGWFGPDENTLYEAIPSAVSGLGEDPDELFSGDVRIGVGGGYDTGGRVFYEQRDPRPCTISAIIPEIEAGDPTG
jgi:hypothetical protein